jgi:dimethylargininase
VTFTHAIVRPPGANFAAGLTSAEGSPDIPRALEQHAAYCEALTACGLKVTRLAADLDFPDSTFVEDAAIVTPRGAIITRPGAVTRRGEIARVGEALAEFFPHCSRVDAPGTVDGGDVCEADGHFLVGVSARTNAAGAEQLKLLLEGLGFSAALLDIRSNPSLLHLKTGIAYLGDGIWVLGPGLTPELLRGNGCNVRDVIEAAPSEAYAANCVRVNDDVLIAAGFPGIAAALRGRGLRPRVLDVSEFKKMDGGLSCLSLRFRA